MPEKKKMALMALRQLASQRKRQKEYTAIMLDGIKGADRYGRR